MFCSWRTDDEPGASARGGEKVDVGQERLAEVGRHRDVLAKAPVLGGAEEEREHRVGGPAVERPALDDRLGVPSPEDDPDGIEVEWLPGGEGPTGDLAAEGAQGRIERDGRTRRAGTAGSGLRGHGPHHERTH